MVCEGHAAFSLSTTHGWRYGMHELEHANLAWNSYIEICVMGKVIYITLSQIQDVSDYHIEAEYKWPPFCRHFLMHFLEWKVFYFDWNITELSCKDFIGYRGALQWRHNGRDGVSNHQPHDCFLNRLFRRRSKKTSKLCVTGLCEGNSPVTGEFPTQRASNAENVSIRWRHHTLIITSKPTRNDHHFADTFACIFLNGTFSILIEIVLK